MRKLHGVPTVFYAPDGNGSATDDLDSLFGEEKDDKDESKEDPLAMTLPDSDEVPADFRGKTLKDALTAVNALSANYTKASQEKAELARALEQATKRGEGDGKPEGKPDGTPTPTADPALAIMLEDVIESRVDKALAGMEYMGEYKAEVLAVLQNVPDPAARVNRETIKAAVEYVAGKHISDLMGKKSHGDVHVESQAGAPFSMPKPPSVELEGGEKAILAIYYGGDLKAARTGVFGEPKEE